MRPTSSVCPYDDAVDIDDASDVMLIRIDTIIGAKWGYCLRYENCINWCAYYDTFEAARDALVADLSREKRFVLAARAKGTVAL